MYLSKHRAVAYLFGSLFALAVLSACGDTTNIMAPPNETASIVLPPFQNQTLEIGVNTSFYQSITFNAPANVYPQLDVTFAPNNGVVTFADVVPEAWPIWSANDRADIRPWGFGVNLLGVRLGEVDVIVTVRGTKMTSKFHIVVRAQDNLKG